MLMLCFRSDLTDGLQLALDYWNGSDTDQGWKWAESVQAIADRYTLPKHQIVANCEISASAYDTSTRCVECGNPRGVSSRTDFQANRNIDYRCSSCRTAALQRTQLAQAAREASIRSAQSQIIAEASDRDLSVDYESLAYSDAVIAYAIMLASDDACETGCFGDAQQLHLCSSDSLSGRVLDRLLNSGVLGFRSNTPINAIVMTDGGGWQYDPYKIQWRFAFDARGKTPIEVFSELGKRIQPDLADPNVIESSNELWWLLAMDDAALFLDEEVKHYRIPDYRRGPKTDEALRYALERFSIPQVRRQIKCCVEKAASFAMTRDVSSRHALNTIPGRLIGYVDRALSDGWTIHPFVRDWTNEEPRLMTLLFDRVLGTGSVGFRTTTGEMLTSEVAS
jgi:hypothetical protein